MYLLSSSLRLWFGILDGLRKGPLLITGGSAPGHTSASSADSLDIRRNSVSNHMKVSLRREETAGAVEDDGTLDTRIETNLLADTEPETDPSAGTGTETDTSVGTG
nr:hypothetical protein Iba_scaffold37921CG0230 [Ipomoea batatas]